MTEALVSRHSKEVALAGGAQGPGWKMGRYVTVCGECAWGSASPRFLLSEEYSWHLLSRFVRADSLSVPEGTGWSEYRGGQSSRYSLLELHGHCAPLNIVSCTIR